MNANRARVYPHIVRGVEEQLSNDSDESDSVASVVANDTGVESPESESDNDSKLEISQSWSTLRTSRMVELTNLRGRKFKLPARITQRRLSKVMLKLNRQSISLDLAGGFGCMCKRTCPFDKIPLEVLEDMRYAIAKCSSECDAKEVICNMLLRHPQTNDGFALDIGAHCEPLRLCARSFAGILGVLFDCLECTLTFYACLGRFRRASCMQL